MKDWKTYALILLAAWCAWLTWHRASPVAGKSVDILEGYRLYDHWHYMKRARLLLSPDGRIIGIERLPAVDADEIQG